MQTAFAGVMVDLVYADRARNGPGRPYVIEVEVAQKKLQSEHSCRALKGAHAYYLHVVEIIMFVTNAAATYLKIQKTQSCS